MTQTDPKTPRADRETVQGASGDTMKAIIYTLCWLLGTSVLKIGILYPMEQAFLPKKVRCEYNQQGPCCSYSLATRLFSRRRGSVRVLSAHLYEATHRFPLSHTSRTCAPLDQTPNDLSSTRYACRSGPRGNRN